MSALAGSALPTARKRKKAGFTDNIDAPDISAGSSGRPSGSGSGPSRLIQQQATAAAAAARAVREQEGGDDNGGPLREADQPSEESEHAIKARRRQENWKKLMPELRSKYLDTLPCNITRTSKQASAMQTALQAEINGLLCPRCHPSADGPEPPQLQPFIDEQQPQPQLDGPEHSTHSDSFVWYFGLDGCFPLAMMKCKCASCNLTFMPNALDFGCFPSSPITPHVWYDLKVLHLYKKYGVMDGLSATGESI